MGNYKKMWERKKLKFLPGLGLFCTHDHCTKLEEAKEKGEH